MATKKYFTDDSLKTFVDEIKEYTDNAVSGKADTDHKHAISDVTNLQTTLDSKAVNDHKHSGGDITSGTVSADRLPKASSSAAGIVTNETQTFAGQKTFSGKIIANDGLRTGGNISSNSAATNDIGAAGTPFNNIYTKNIVLYGNSNISSTGRLETEREGTTSVEGRTVLTVGNNTAKGEEGNSTGFLKVYNNNKGCINLQTTHTSDTDYYVGLPSKAGTLLTSNDIIPVSKGGTGATTAADALTNLGVTATADELNKMDGVTATTTELNYVDGVTSNIQTQLDGKVPTTRKVNNKPLSTDITLSASDVGADVAGAATTALEEANSYTDTSIYNLSEGVISIVSTMYGDDMDMEAEVFPSIREIASDEADTAEANAKSYTDGKISALLDGATDATLDSIKELADAIKENDSAIEALNGIASGKADKTHSHDDRYYTETEIDTKVSTLNTAINGKAASSHKHAISDVTNLQGALDGKAASSHNHIYYGVCSTAADAAAKTVTIDNFSLVTGAMVIVKFTNANSIANPTLNVNGTGAIPIMRYGTTAVSTGTTSTGWIAGAVQMFVYDGTNWIRDYWNNSTYTPASLGSGYGTCSTAAATTAKAATLSSYSLTTGGIVSVKFTNAVPASATLNINSKGAKPIYYKGAAITANVIKAGDIATFVYSSQYHLLSVDRWHNDITGKQNTITGGATTITDSNLTVSRALISNSSGKVAVSEVTSTELGYLDGVTSNVQTQLDTKVPTTRKVNNKALSADISLTYTDVGAAPSSHNHSAANITSGILGVARGGTGNSDGYVRAGALADSTIGTLATAEGRNTTASGSYSHAEGNYTEATGSSSHAEGQTSTASGIASHAEGNNSTASGNYSHAEGDFAAASGKGAHAEGTYTLASSDYQHVQGKYNVEDKNGDYAHIVGNGTGTSARSNAHTVDWYGNAWYAGDVYVGGADQSNGAKLVDSNDIIPVENGGTGATEVLSAANNLEVYSLTQGAAISEGTDLNDLVNVGNYRCTTSSVSNSLINSPCPGWLFMLKVGHLPNNSDYLYQEVIKYDNNKRYYRRKRQDEDWSEWNESFSSSDIVPVENGGTGASTPAGARTNLEITPENIGALSTTNGGTVAGFTELKGGFGRGNEVAEAVSLIDSPADGIQYSSATNGVGILKIVLPQDLGANTMVKFDVDIYSYSRQSIVTYTFGGQIYTSSTDGTYGWANRTWDIQGTHRQDELLNLPITFGRHDSKAAISIGRADTEWGYNIVTIKNITAFYNNYGFTRWSNGWQIILDANPLAETLATASNPIAESRTNLGITSSTTVPTAAPVTGEGSVCFVIDNGAPTPIEEGGTGGITLSEATDNLQVPSLTQGEQLTEGADLNSVVAIGNYRCSNTDIADSLVNCPCVGYFFTMKVGHLPNNPTYLYQEIIVFGNGIRWYRKKSGSSASWSEWMKDFNSASHVPITNGGTGNTLVNAPNNAIIRKGADVDYLWYTPTKSGAFYATAENGSPTFGILPREQGGTGYNYRYETITTTRNSTYSDADFSAGTRYYPYLHMCFTRQYHETATSLTAGTTYTIATITADYAPSYTTALTVDSSKNISAYIDANGNVIVRAREAVPSGYMIRISGWWSSK